MDVYQGKVYSGSRRVYLGEQGVLEVMTMAFQTLLGNEPEKLRQMLADDLEMLNLIVGLLYRYVPKL